MWDLFYPYLFNHVRQSSSHHKMVGTFLDWARDWRYFAVDCGSADLENNCPASSKKRIDCCAAAFAKTICKFFSVSPTFLETIAAVFTLYTCFFSNWPKYCASCSLVPLVEDDKITIFFGSVFDGLRSPEIAFRLSAPMVKESSGAIGDSVRGGSCFWASAAKNMNIDAKRIMHLIIREIFMKVDLPLRFGCRSPENGRRAFALTLSSRHKKGRREFDLSAPHWNFIEPIYWRLDLIYKLKPI